jgi:hypothetical protein
MTNDSTRNASSSSLDTDFDQLGDRLARLRAEESAAREKLEVWINAVQLAIRDDGPLPPTGARSQWRAAVAELDTALAEFESLTLSRRR